MCSALCRQAGWLAGWFIVSKVQTFHPLACTLPCPEAVLLVGMSSVFRDLVRLLAPEETFIYVRIHSSVHNVEGKEERKIYYLYVCVIIIIIIITTIIIIIIIITTYTVIIITIIIIIIVIIIVLLFYS